MSASKTWFCSAYVSLYCTVMSCFLLGCNTRIIWPVRKESPQAIAVHIYLTRHFEKCVVPAPPPAESIMCTVRLSYRRSSFAHYSWLCISLCINTHAPINIYTVYIYIYICVFLNVKMSSSKYYSQRLYSINLETTEPPTGPCVRAGRWPPPPP